MGLRSRRLAERKREKEKESFCQHPLCAPGNDRHVRDAYFNAIAFAALANDEVVTEEERRAILSICAKLGFPIEMIDSVFDAEQRIIDQCMEDRFMADCIGSLPNLEILNCFLSEFDSIWNEGCGADEELRAWHADFKRWARCLPGAETTCLQIAEARSRLIRCLEMRCRNVLQVSEMDRGQIDYGDTLEARDDSESFCEDDIDFCDDLPNDSLRSFSRINSSIGFDDDIEERGDL